MQRASCARDHVSALRCQRALLVCANPGRSAAVRLTARAKAAARAAPIRGRRPAPSRRAAWPASCGRGSTPRVRRDARFGCALAEPASGHATATATNGTMTRRRKRFTTRDEAQTLQDAADVEHALDRIGPRVIANVMPASRHLSHASRPNPVGSTNDHVGTSSTSSAAPLSSTGATSRSSTAAVVRSSSPARRRASGRRPLVADLDIPGVPALYSQAECRCASNRTAVGRPTPPRQQEPWCQAGRQAPQERQQALGERLAASRRRQCPVPSTTATSQAARRNLSGLRICN